MGKESRILWEKEGSRKSKQNWKDRGKGAQLHLVSWEQEMSKLVVFIGGTDVQCTVCMSNAL